MSLEFLRFVWCRASEQRLPTYSNVVRVYHFTLMLYLTSHNVLQILSLLLYTKPPELAIIALVAICNMQYYYIYPSQINYL